MAKRIHYKKGFKYQLHHDYFEHIPIQPEQPIKTQFIKLDLHGNLVIRRGYAWDGVSGGCPDFDAMMRGSLKHDALYQLMRMELLNVKWRETADSMFKRDSKIDGAWHWFARRAYKALRWFGKSNAMAKKLKPVLVSPKP